MTCTVSMWSVPTPPAVALALTAMHGITRYLDDFSLNHEY